MMSPFNYYKHTTAVIDDGCFIGDGTKIWHFTHLMKGCTIGTNCIIGQNVFIGNNVVLGNNVKVQNNVSIYSGTICASDVFIGPSLVFTNVINPRSAVERKNEFKNTIINKGASIGANATIVCGNDLGKYCMIGAGSVVTKPIKAYALVVGNPARQCGWISEYGQKLHFSIEGKAVCIEQGEEYNLIDNIVTKAVI